MARSKQTSQKTEKEKNKKRRQKEKDEKKAFRKANSNKGKGMESMMAFVDHNGQLTDTLPDPKLKHEVKLEDIQLGARSFEREDAQGPRTGRIAIYNTQKLYGFIKDNVTQEKIFFHYSNVNGPVKEGDMVNYEIAKGPKGMNAVNVTVIG
jgi:cold shock CspA family protein